MSSESLSKESATSPLKCNTWLVMWWMFIFETMAFVIPLKRDLYHGIDLQETNISTFDDVPFAMVGYVIVLWRVLLPTHRPYLQKSDSVLSFASGGSHASNNRNLGGLGVSSWRSMGESPQGGLLYVRCSMGTWNIFTHTFGLIYWRSTFRS